jgi:hypothetical protein
MASTAQTVVTAGDSAAHEEVSLLRLYILRAMYLLMIVGLGALVVPEIISHAPASRGVIPCLLGGLWALAFVGLRYPVAMLPLLMFELVWKTMWMVAYGLPQWFSGLRPPTFDEDFLNIGWGAILLVVIPWDYVWRQYVKRPGARWR